MYLGTGKQLFRNKAKNAEHLPSTDTQGIINLLTAHGSRHGDQQSNDY